MTRTQLYLPESQYEELKHLASLRKQTFAELVREFLGEKLMEEKKGKRKKEKNAVAELLKSLKKIKKFKKMGGLRDGSIKHDYYLYQKWQR